MSNVVLISGSLRADSANTAALRAAAARLSLSESVDGGPSVSVQQATIGDLPIYSEDIEDAGWPAPVERLQNAVAEADALVIATPEYNGSLPGGLKNALDWLSRPYGASALEGTPVATISTSPSQYGARWAHDHLRHVLATSGAPVINDEAVVLPGIFEARDETGDIVDPEVLAAINELADQVLAAVGRPRTAEGVYGIASDTGATVAAD